MRELEQLGRDVREQLGEPSQTFLRAQRQELQRAFAVSSAPRFGVRRWLAAAAVVSLVACAALLWRGQVSPSQPTLAATETVLNAPTLARRVELADGSALVVAPRSLARVNATREFTRCVVEVGTLHFEVAPQNKRQFTVVAGAFEIRVVGTRFSVSRDTSGVVDVLVEHGLVRVHAPGRNGPIELEAGDRLRGDEHGLSLTRGSTLAPAPLPALAEPSASPSVEPSASANASRTGVPDIGKANGVAVRADWQSLYREHNYAAALTAAKQAGVERLLESLGAQGLSELADAAHVGADNELALRAFAAIERRFPGSAQARDAVFLSGRIYAARGQADAARARFEKYLALSANGSYSLEATGRLVELYSARGDQRQKAMARSYLERAPNGPYQRLCRSVLASP